MHTDFDTKISVILPTYNTEEYILKRAIYSVLNQTFSNIELLVIDDGSNVAFSGIQKDINDTRIVWINLKKNYGVSYARNCGVKLASGNYIAFIDGDDYWDGKKLEEQIYALHNTNKHWCFTGYALTKNNKIIRKYLCQSNNIRVSEILKKNIVGGGCSSVLILKSFLQEVGEFDEGVVEDWDLWIRLSTHSKPAVLQEVLTYVTVGNPKSRSRQTEKRVRRFEKLYQKHQALFRQYNVDKLFRAYIFITQARHFVYEKKRLRALYLLLNAVRIEPRTLYSRSFYGVIIRMFGIWIW